MSELQEVYGWDAFIYGIAEKKIFDKANGHDSIINVELAPAYDVLRYAGHEQRKNKIINKYYEK